MCTDLLISVPEKDVAVVARSMEFAQDLNSKVKYHEAGQPFKVLGETLWTSKHNYVTIDGDIKVPHLNFEVVASTDGQNGKGLSIGALWFAGFAYYEPIPGGINYAFFVDYVLSHYETVQQVLDDVNSGKLKLSGNKIETELAPLHFPLHDRTGASGLIEFSKGQTLAILNPSNVCTNSPGIDWHLNNLGYYASLSFVAPTVNVGGTTYPLSGMGAGLRGIPGDSFPASRFVRSFYKLQFALQNRKPTNAEEAVNLGVHLMNSVDITAGESQDFVTEKDKEKGKVAGFDYTQWVVIKDLVNNRLYYRTYDSFGFVCVDFAHTNFHALNGQKYDLEKVGAIAQATKAPPAHHAHEKEAHHH